MVFTPLMAFGAAGLVATTFLSASILPFPSDPFVVAAVPLLGPLPTFFISLVSGMGGALLNYIIGLKGVHRLVARQPDLEAKAERWFARWGIIVLVVAPWIPVVGDLTMIVAGSLEMKLGRFILATAIGKSIKTAALVFLGVSLLRVLGL